MDKKKAKVYMFDPLIYPRKIWIAVTTESQIEGYSTLNEFDENTNSMTQAANDVKHNFGGIFIRFKNKTKMTHPTIAHEAIHAALDIFEYIQEPIDDAHSEAFAYLVEWIVKCCEEVKIKIKNQKNEHKLRSKSDV